MRRPATDINSKQQRILDFIIESLQQRYRCPSVREIGDHMGLSSTSTVQSHLNTLEKFGYITRDANKNRSITVVNMPDVPAEFVLPTALLGSSECFLLRVRGESMRDIGMYEGDLLIVRNQSTANNGDIVVARIDDEATVKRFYKESDHIRLMPENEEFEPIITRNCVIEGRVIGLIRDHI